MPDEGKNSPEKNFCREYRMLADAFDLLGKDETFMKVWESLLPQDANFLPSQETENTKLIKHHFASVLEIFTEELSTGSIRKLSSSGSRCPRKLVTTKTL